MISGYIQIQIVGSHLTTRPVGGGLKRGLGLPDGALLAERKGVRLAANWK